MKPNPTPDIERIAEEMTDAQREAMLRVDPHDVDQVGAGTFARLCSSGLFRVAPGWARVEMTELGLAVRNHLKETADDRA